MGFYEEIFYLFEESNRDTELFLDWAINFRYNDEEPSITIHYMPTEELEDLFYSEFEELEDVSFFLDRVFDFRLENHLEEPAVSITGFFPLPDISDCDGFGENMAMDLYEKIQATDADNLKFFQQEAFLIEVLAWLSEQVDFDDCWHDECESNFVETPEVF